MAYPRILFFIDGPSPSLDEQLAADKLMPCRVSFRNARFIVAGNALEQCDGWFGEVTPQAYKDAFKPAEQAIKDFNSQRLKDHKTKARSLQLVKQKASSRAVEDTKVKAEQANKELLEKQEAAKQAKAAVEKAQAAWQRNADRT